MDQARNVKWPSADGIPGGTTPSQDRWHAQKSNIHAYVIVAPSMSIGIASPNIHGYSEAMIQRTTYTERIATALRRAPDGRSARGAAVRQGEPGGTDHPGTPGDDL